MLKNQENPKASEVAKNSTLLQDYGSEGLEIFRLTRI